MISVLGAWGPLARDVDSVILASQILFDGMEANKIDPMIAPLPFNDEVSLKYVYLRKILFQKRIHIQQNYAT